MIFNCNIFLKSYHHSWKWTLRFISILSLNFIINLSTTFYSVFDLESVSTANINVAIFLELVNSCFAWTWNEFCGIWSFDTAGMYTFIIFQLGMFWFFFHFWIHSNLNYKMSIGVSPPIRLQRQHQNVITLVVNTQITTVNNGATFNIRAYPFIFKIITNIIIT